MKSTVFAIAMLLWVSPALALDFHGYDCTDDCSGHEAGYEWAEDNNITSEYNCSGNSNSFEEGCQAYVEENSSYGDDSEDGESDY